MVVAVILCASIVAPLSPKPVALTGHNDAVTCLAVDEAEKVLVTGGSDGHVLIWNLADATLLGTRNLDLEDMLNRRGISDVQLSPDGRWIAASGARRAVVWSIQGDASDPHCSFRTNVDSIHEVAFDSSSEYLFAIHSDHVIDGWRISDRTRVEQGNLPCICAVKKKPRLRWPEVPLRVGIQLVCSSRWPLPMQSGRSVPAAPSCISCRSNSTEWTPDFGLTAWRCRRAG